jgi:hypothetical protein
VGSFPATSKWSPTWPETRQERVDRIVREALALDRIPSPTKVAWFHYLPDHDPRLTDRTDN